MSSQRPSREIEPIGRWPLVSILVPCRNEARCIASCLDSILASTYPHDRLEILIADGLSVDGTRDIVSGYAANDGRFRLLDNPGRTAPTGLNLAIREAVGEVIVRMDAHATFPPEYLVRLVAALDETGADNVGTVVITVPADDTMMAQAIAVGLSHPFGVGNSRFRIGTTVRRWVDHVPFGCWRRATLERLGPFDESLIRGQDVELNARILARGGRILLLPDVSSTYYARRTLGQVGRMLYQYGYFKPLVARKIGKVLTLRQMAPPALVLAIAAALLLGLWWDPPALPLALVVGPYAALVAASATVAVVRQGACCGLALLAVLPVMHTSYGLGYLRGLFDHFLLSRWSPPSRREVALTR